MADELTPVRKWIVNQMTALLPSETSEICSNTDEIMFKEWTRMTQQSLESTWIQEDTQRAVNNVVTKVQTPLRFQKGAQIAANKALSIIEQRREEYKRNAAIVSGSQALNEAAMYAPVGTTTSCNAFLGVVVQKTLAVGGLANRNFPSFNLPKAGGAAWSFYPNPEKLPKPGDFYELGKRVKVGKDGEVLQFQHVGIIIAVSGSGWESADSGQGGPSVGYDKIKRVKRNASDGMLGWIDADKFFENWKGPGSTTN